MKRRGYLGRVLRVRCEGEIPQPSSKENPRKDFVVLVVFFFFFWIFLWVGCKRRNDIVANENVQPSEDKESNSKAASSSKNEF